MDMLALQERSGITGSLLDRHLPWKIFAHPDAPRRGHQLGCAWTHSRWRVARKRHRVWRHRQRHMRNRHAGETLCSPDLKQFEMAAFERIIYIQPGSNDF
jgi:hypothetical protein